ncbi:MAG: ATP-binding cassette domain-containing protein, partial [Raoultibacter sp.]
MKPIDIIEHEATEHVSAAEHHGHSHATRSHHAHGHHLLQVEDLTISFTMYDPDAPSFFRAHKVDKAVIENLSISVHAGEIVAVVGASGSGKTLLADAIFGLYEPNASVTGRIWFDGELMDAPSLQALRGKGISLVPQSVSHLDPLMKVGKQVQGFVADDTDHAGERRAEQQRLFERYGLSPHVGD